MYKSKKVLIVFTAAEIFFVLCVTGCNPGTQPSSADTAAVETGGSNLNSSKSTEAETAIAASLSTDGMKADTSNDTVPDTVPDTDSRPKKKYVFGSEIDPDEPCDHCEQRFCTKINGDNFIEECTKGKQAELCKAVVECAVKTNCASKKSADCYCGMDSDIGKCMVDGGDGPCKAVIEKAADSKKPSEIAARFGNPAYVIGRAVAWIDCKTRYCPKCNEP